MHKTVAYFCCFRLEENLDFLDFVQNSFKILTTESFMVMKGDIKTRVCVFESRTGNECFFLTFVVPNVQYFCLKKQK